jgi:Arc/MetJ-type ribon-helix-helix transcriptional regulator
MVQRCVRLPDAVNEQVMNAVRSDGYASIAAFVRTAVQNELKRRQAGAAQSEREVAATLERQSRDMKGLAAAINAQFALLDAFARIMLHCIPEPSADAHQAAVAQARQRYQKLLKMAAINMKGEAQVAMSELERHGE